MTKRLESKYKICKKKGGIYKNIFGIEKCTKFRSIRILKRNSFLAKQKFKKLSSFNKRLQIKQGLKHFYSNVSDKAFQQLLIKSIKSQSPTLNKLISLLESRLDSILYRACFANSLHMARQLISHGFIYVNSKLVNSMQVVLFKGDFLEVKDKNIALQSKLVNILKQCRFKQYFNLIDSKKHFFYKKSDIIKKNNKFLFLLTKSLNSKSRNLTAILKKICLHYNNFVYVKKNKKLELIPLHLEANYKILKVIFLWDPLFQDTYYPIRVKYKKHIKSELFSYNEVIYND